MTSVPPRLNQAPPVLLTAPDGGVPAAWMTWLTTEHYNLQTQRAATIGEANGRASLFLGALSAGLIALGFATGGGARSAGTTTFQVLVLSSLVVLGGITFLRCLQIAIDDWISASLSSSCECSTASCYRSWRAHWRR